jgi:alkyl hydroperoxide reductase subunit AhpC
LGECWGVLECHPQDFTPVCTTELSRLAQLSDEFEMRNVKILCITVESQTQVKDDYKWIEDVEMLSNCEVPFPLIDDKNGILCKQIGIISHVRR